jgi:20S proteasome alpha/beta subunit
MTCIIGVRCVDGVVLAGDRRVLRGTEYSDEPKIKRAFSGFVVGASGLSGLMDKFLFEMELYMGSESFKKEPSWRNFLNVLEDIVAKLFDRYGSRLDENEVIETGAFAFDVLCACKEYLDKASLYHLYRNGFAQQVKTFDIIGHGLYCALPFIKTLYNEKRTMIEMAKVCAFTLKLIDEANIDLTVGGEPQIFLIPDNGDEKELSQKEINDLLNSFKPKDILETAKTLTTLTCVLD